MFFKHDNLTRLGGPEFHRRFLDDESRLSTDEICISINVHTNTNEKRDISCSGFTWIPYHHHNHCCRRRCACSDLPVLHTVHLLSKSKDGKTIPSVPVTLETVNKLVINPAAAAAEGSSGPLACVRVCVWSCGVPYRLESRITFRHPRRQKTFLVVDICYCRMSSFVQGGQICKNVSCICVNVHTIHIYVYNL